MEKQYIPEHHLLTLLAKKMSASQIANTLDISRPTVTAVITRDYPHLLPTLKANGKAKHGGNRKYNVHNT